MNDDVISKVIDVIINCSSTTVWSTCVYKIMSDKVVQRNKKSGYDDENDDTIEHIRLPALHRKVS